MKLSANPLCLLTSAAFYSIGASAAQAAPANNINPASVMALAGFTMLATFIAVFSRSALRRARLEHQATALRARQDGLTGLPNRTAFMEELTASLSRPGEAAVIFLDLDGFKSINDNFGHGAGDDFLKASAARLSAAAGPGTVLARMGGDEFAIAVSGPDARALANAIAGKVIETMAQPMRQSGRELAAGASLGIAFGAGREVEAAELLKRADLAMYEAKRSGGGGYAVFDSRLASQRKRREDMFSAIRRLLEANAPLPIFYQPIAAAASGDIVAARAMLVWPDV